jgi:hypothetical protein
MYGVLKRQYLAANTIGELTLFNDNNEIIYSCKTVELAWKDNQKRISCIPEAIYDIELVGPSAKIKYDHFWITNVPNRDGIKIHVANYSKQLMGCIAPGLTHADLNKDNLIDVTNSTKALKGLLEAVRKEKIRKFKLTIIKK